MKTLKIAEETHTKLTRVKGELMAENGKEKTYDETILELVSFWKEWHEVIIDHLGLIDMVKEKYHMPDSPTALGYIITEHSGICKERE